MTDESQGKHNSLDSIAKVSKVTPDKRKQHLIRQTQFVLLLVVCLVIAVLMFMPHHTKENQPVEKQSAGFSDLTLSQNLELIEHLKNEERNKIRMVSQNTKTPSVYGPPKLRTQAYKTKKALTKEIQVRMNASSSFEIDTLAADSVPQGGNSATQNGMNSKTLAGNDPNSQFINSQNEITSVSAKKLPHPSLTVPAGEMIPATLETAINSDLPGMARAITTRDVYSLIDGNLLIPRGSTLVGQFSSGVIEGQSRILVVWNRVQMADGIIVTLNSPGTDSLGRSGQGADNIDRHFFERFGTSTLLSILGAYTATSGVNGQDQYNSASQYRIGIANSFQQTAAQTLEKSATIAPTLQINQGTRINVFVAHDLDFAGVGQPKQIQTALQVRSPVWK